MRDDPNMLIEKLYLSSRATHAAKNNGLRTAGDLMNYLRVTPDSEILRSPNCGRKTLAEYREWQRENEETDKRDPWREEQIRIRDGIADGLRKRGLSDRDYTRIGRRNIYIVLLRLNGQSMAEIGRRVGLSRGAVIHVLFRYKKRMAEIFEFKEMISKKERMLPVADYHSAVHTELARLARNIERNGGTADANEVLELARAVQWFAHSFDRLWGAYKAYGEKD